MTDAVMLARIQFAFTISFHIVLPAFTIGLASYLMVLEALWLRTGRQVYMDLYRYWLKPFALSFAMGVVSGIVMAYSFGLNWGGFSDKAGPIIGPLMGYEVLTAFFLEAGFLGIMLFGIRRVGRTVHFAATCTVALGTLISAFWILSANSWMQTPTGFTLSPEGRFIPADWWAIIFNPSFHVRLPHMVLASYLTTAFVVGGIGAWHVLRDRRNEAAKLMFSMAMWMAAIVAPIQVYVGDAHGLNTLEHQPAKVAAMEGHWEGGGPVPLILFGWPNDRAETTDWALAVPHLGSLILTHTWDGGIKGLKDFPPQDRPPALVPFWGFRIMVGIGVLMVLVGFWSLLRRWEGRLYESRWLLRAAVAMTPAGFIALLSGWFVTEVGRQPFLVYGHLRTLDSASPIDAPGVATSLAGFVLVYLIVFGAGFTYMARLLSRPPVPGEPEPAAVPIRSAGITPGPAGATAERPAP